MAEKAKKTDDVEAKKKSEPKKKPESKTKSEAKTKSEPKKQSEPKPHAPGSSRWVVPTFVTVGLLGVIWMVVFYVSSTTGIQVPLMSDIGYWNLAIGMGLLAIALFLTTQWK